MATQEQDDIDAATAALARIPDLKTSIVSYIADRDAKMKEVTDALTLSNSDRAKLNAATAAANAAIDDSANAILAGTPAAPPTPLPPVEPVPLT